MNAANIALLVALSASFDDQAEQHEKEACFTGGRPFAAMLTHLNRSLASATLAAAVALKAHDAALEAKVTGLVRCPTCKNSVPLSTAVNGALTCPRCVEVFPVPKERQA